MKNQWRIIIGLILTLVIVIFAVLNNMPVPINFGFSTLSAPLIIVIIGSAFFRGNHYLFSYNWNYVATTP